MNRFKGKANILYYS